MGKDSLLKPTSKKSDPEKATSESARPEKEGKKQASAKKGTSGKKEKKQAAPRKTAAQKTAEKKDAAITCSIKTGEGERMESQQHTIEKKIDTRHPLPPIQHKTPDPLVKPLAIFGVCVAVILAMITAVSILNTRNYYIQTGDGAVEIWQGVFAPVGRERLMTLHGAQAPEPVKDVYTKKEAYKIIFNSYIDKSDALLGVQDMPDFDGIKYYLNKAMAFATTDEQKEFVRTRMAKIKLGTLLYKADLAAGKGTVSGLEESLSHLEKAAQLDLDHDDAEFVDLKIKSIKNLIADSKRNQ